MARRSRFRRVAKWAGVCVCVLIMAAWGASLAYSVIWHAGPRTRVWVFPNYVQIGVYDIDLHRRVTGGASLPAGLPPHMPVQPPNPKIELRKYGPTGQWRPAHYQRIGFFLPKPQIFTKSRSSPNTRFAINIPYWLPLLIAGIATSVLFYRDRRIPPGHCQTCRYNLTGNTSGVCPECGAVVEINPALTASAGTQEPNGASRV